MPIGTSEVSGAGYCTIDDYKAVVGEDRVITSLEHAREVYVGYHALLCRIGRYRPVALLARLATGLARRAEVPGTSNPVLGIYDSLGVNGLATLQHVGTPSLLSLGLADVLRWLPVRARISAISTLGVRIRSPQLFFAKLFDIYSEVAGRVHAAFPGVAEVHAANERSIGCAPFLAAARFGLGWKVTVLQHGNPIADFLPTLANHYVCRSERWLAFLRREQLVQTASKGREFEPLPWISHDPGSRHVLLLLHNVGYLEPRLDYRLLTHRIAELCSSRGYSLVVAPHPASNESYGLPLVRKGDAPAFALAVGFRSTALDQLPAGMPSCSLLDFWPEYFLGEGSPERIPEFFDRLGVALR